MKFDSMAMAAVAAEIDACAGGQVQQVHQPEAETVLLAIRTGGSTRTLLLSAHARYGRVHFATGRFPNPEVPPAFCMLLRKHLKGMALVGARQIDFDRVLHLYFRGGGAELRLILEVMGKHGNLILVSPEGIVLGAIKRISSRESRLRSVMPGLPYFPPPTGGKADPAGATAEEVRRTIASYPNTEAGDLLRAHFSLGPATLDAVLRRSKIGTSVRAGDADAEDLAAALRAVADVAQYRPAVLVDARWEPLGLSLLPDTPLPPGGSLRLASSASEALDAIYGYRIAHEKVEDRRRELQRALENAARAVRRRIREAEEGIEAARSAPDLEREATLILANIQGIPRGARSATVVDFYDPEQKQVELALDPALTAQEQAERRFKRARKLAASIPHMERQREEGRLRCEALDALRLKLEAARASEELESLAGELRELGERPEALRVSSRQNEEGPGVQRRVVRGFEVLLGRNATENDRLTIRMAAPDDWWLHARGIASAHVVVRTGRHPERVPPEVLREAARLCALHSAAKHSRLVSVDITLRKHVVKRRGSAPGEVQYSHEKTLHIEPGLA